jgi:hypothetical protein
VFISLSRKALREVDGILPVRVSSTGNGLCRALGTSGYIVEQVRPMLLASVRYNNLYQHVVMKGQCVA